LVDKERQVMTIIGDTKDSRETDTDTGELIMIGAYRRNGVERGGIKIIAWLVIDIDEG
jgi:hypothetical protein